MGSSLHNFELTDHRFPHSLHFCKTCRVCREHRVEIAKGLEQAPGERLHILTGNGPKKHEFQQFIVRHGGSTTLHEAIPQAFSVILNIGRQLAARRCDGQSIRPVKVELALRGFPERELGLTGHGGIIAPTWLMRR